MAKHLFLPASTAGSRGFAVPLVLVFATIMGLLATFVIRSNSHNFRQNLTSYNQLQAAFVARAGLEHALLKVKYLHRELFDAACFAQGRNPLFNFSQPLDPSFNPGPKYCLTQSDATGAGQTTSGFISPTRLSSALSGARSPPSKWLEGFRSDINSVGSTNVMRMNELPDEIKSRMREPFTAQYDAAAIEVLTQDTNENLGQNTVSNQVVVKFSISASVTTARQETFDQELFRTVRVARDRGL